MQGKSKPSIKWRNKDEAQLKRVVTNFNAKINRLIKKEPKAIEYLPQKISVKELKAKISTRQDFNRELKSIQRFSRKGVEQAVKASSGNVVTKWEKQEVARKVSTINARRSRLLKEELNTEATLKGVPLGRKRGGMGEDTTAELRPKKFDFDKIKAGREWELYKKSVDRQINSRYYDQLDSVYRNNYIKALENANIPNREEIINIINKIPDDRFYRFASSDKTLELGFIYDEAEAFIRGQTIYEGWINVFNSNFAENGEQLDFDYDLSFYV